jgi:hypothetical protein
VKWSLKDKKSEPGRVFQLASVILDFEGTIVTELQAALSRVCEVVSNGKKSEPGRVFQLASVTLSSFV